MSSLREQRAFLLYSSSKKRKRGLEKNWIPAIPVRLISPPSVLVAAVELQRKRWRVRVHSVLQCKLENVSGSGVCGATWRGDALSFQQRGDASTLLMVHWLPPFLVTAESWGNGKMSPRAAAAPLYATCSSLSGMVSGAQLSASAVSLSLWWLPWWDVSRAVLSLLHPCSCRAVPQPWRFPSPWEFRGLGRRTRLAAGGAVLLAGEGVRKRLLTLKPPSALEMGLPSSSLSAWPPLPSCLLWAEVPRPHRTLPSLLEGLEPALVLPVPHCMYNTLGNVGTGCTGRRINEGWWSRAGKIDPTELPC